MTTAIACVLMFVQMMMDIERARNETIAYLEKVRNGGTKKFVYCLSFLGLVRFIEVRITLIKHGLNKPLIEQGVIKIIAANTSKLELLSV